MNLEDFLHPDYSGIRIGLEDSKKSEVVNIEPYFRGKIGALLLNVISYGEGLTKDYVISFNKKEDIDMMIKKLEVLTLS